MVRKGNRIYLLHFKPQRLQSLNIYTSNYFDKFVLALELLGLTLMGLSLSLLFCFTLERFSLVVSLERSCSSTSLTLLWAYRNENTCFCHFCFISVTEGNKLTSKKSASTSRLPMNFPIGCCGNSKSETFLPKRVTMKYSVTRCLEVPRHRHVSRITLRCRGYESCCRQVFSR